MHADELSNWMLDEHERIHELAAGLRSRVAAPPRGDRAAWIAELRAHFDEFADLARRHLEKEEEAGYLAQVVEARPALAEAIEVIRREHDELTQIFAEVRAAVHELAPTDVLLLRDGCKRIEDLLTWIERHEEHENHIVMYTFTQDIGTGD